MSSNISVVIYEGLKAPSDDILEFLDSLEFVPVQHDPRWAQVYSKLDNEDFYILVACEDSKIVGLSNFTVFNGPLGSIIHANPYMGYGGCSCAPQKESEVIHALMASLLKWAQKSGCITVSVGTPPFSEKLCDSYIAGLEPDFVYRKFYQYNYLDQHPLEKMNAKHRHMIFRKIKNAESSNVKVTLATTPSQLESWLDIYEGRYTEIDAKTLPRTFYRALWDTFGPAGKAELHLAYKDEQFLGGDLFVIGRGIVDCFSNVFSDEGMELHAGFLTIHKALNRFVESKLKRFNWQSGPARGDGVYEFKRRWGAVEGEYSILTKVLGDTTVFTSRPLAEVRNAYGLHFVLPYSLWENK